MSRIQVGRSRVDGRIQLFSSSALQSLEEDTFLVPREMTNKQNARSNIAQDNGDAMYDLAPVLGMADPRAGQYGQVSGVGQHGHPPGPGYGSGAGTGAGAVKEEKEEVLDPLEMDMEDDELLVSLLDSRDLGRYHLCPRRQSCWRI